MFTGMILVIGCVMVAAIIRSHSKANDLPPKAKLLCEVWQMVEEEKRPALQKGRIHIHADHNNLCESGCPKDRMENIY